MSRKSAYALKGRDSAFAAAWKAAAMVRAKLPVEGDKVEEVEGSPVSSSEGDIPPRHLPFADFVARLRDSPPLAA